MAIIGTKSLSIKPPIVRGIVAIYITGLNQIKYNVDGDQMPNDALNHGLVLTAERLRKRFPVTRVGKAANQKFTIHFWTTRLCMAIINLFVVLAITAKQTF